MDDDARPRPRPRSWAADTPEPEAVPGDVTGENDDVDDPVPFSDDELAADDGPDVSEPPTADESASVWIQAPWWVVHGERIDAAALATRKDLRKEKLRLAPHLAGYDTFWGYVDVDPVSVVPTVRAARRALDWRNVALRRWSMPHPLALIVNVVVAAAAALGIAGGPAAHRLVAFAACLIFGVWFVKMVSSLAISSRLAAIVAAAAALACAVALAASTVHMTRWYDVLVGIALAAAGLFVAAMWPIVQAWRVERIYWTSPDGAMVAALLEYGDCVESDPAPQDRRQAVAALDRAATRFEIEWHRANRTGVDVTDRQLRAWAGRIRAETRELQRGFAFGAPSTYVLLMRTYKLMQAIVNRYSLDDHEDTWVRHGSWRRPPTSALARLWVRSKQSGRYVRQCLFAGFIAVTALLLLADTVWNAVPTFIGTHVSRGLGSALNFDPTVRVFVATISLSLFAVAGRVFTRRH
ncbi:hypothetical protein ACFQZ8_05385 [Micromonospora azadirachtae]|uniref:Uncharacterized protein n=1 Tax=Micromonospora azadirachtae TaxID=1970735 RepID=A0ABW2ZXI4_9ACTN